MAVKTRPARALALAILASVPSVTFATDYTWNAPAGGSFATTTNWTPASPIGGPGAADRAVFNLNNTYTVTFPASVANTAFRETQGNVTLNIGSGRSYTVSGNNAFELGNTASQTANLTVPSGTLAMGGTNSGIATVAGSTGNLTITGPGTSFSTGTHFFDIGVSGTGTVSVLNGASASIGNSSHIGEVSGSTGSLIINGSATIATLGTNLRVGQNGTGSLHVDAGATATIGAGLTIGNNSGSQGNFSIGGLTGDNTVNAAGITVGNNPGSTGSLTVWPTSGNVFNNAGELVIARVAGSTGRVAVAGQATWNQSGGSIFVGGSSSGAGGDGTLTVMGTLNVTGPSNGITIRGTGTSPNNGTLNLSLGMISTPRLTRDPNGILNIDGGTLQINNGLLTLNQSSYSLDGTGSTLTFNGAGAGFGGSPLNLTVASVGATTLNVRGGAQVTVANLAAGASSFGNGIISISGTGSTLTTTGSNIIANTGGAALSILAGGQYLASSDMQIGAAGGGFGTLSLAGAGSRVALGSGSFIVGNILDGQGAVFVENGASASGLHMTLGNNGRGDLLVSGAGSTLTLSGRIAAGGGPGGRGSVIVRDGAAVSALEIRVGSATSTSTGEVTATGPLTTLSLPTGVLLVGNGITASTATFSSGATATMSSMQINTASSVHLNAATINLGSIAPNGGVFNFNAGTVNFTGDWTADFPQIRAVLGSAGSLDSGHIIGVAGTMALQYPLTLNGGTLRAGSVSGIGNLLLNSGTFELTNSSLSIGAAGALGANVTVGPGLTLKVSGASDSVSVQSGGTLYIPGGIVSATTTNISGRAQLASPVAQLNGPVNVNSGGVLQGTGQVNGNLLIQAGGAVRVLSNDFLVFGGANNNIYGGVELQGGSIDWRGPVAVESGGIISGRGSIHAASATPGSAGAITNNGTFQLSGGFTDIRGALTSTAGSKIIVTGGGTATFYDDVTLATGSTFQVSANSAAVFFGDVNGTNNFTGSGTKYFEAGTSAVGAVVSPGSTVIEAPASLIASHFREDSLTVNGSATISTSGGTSHLNELNIEADGVLDLKNNSLVLEAGDLTMITSQIRSGLYEGTGIVSTAPASPFRLGSMSNAGTVYSSFQGITGLDGDEVLVRYTLIGDLNLDGTVSISDFIDLASNFNTSTGATWQLGDVNYDGGVTISDFIDLASNFNQSVSGPALPLSEVDAAMLNDFAASVGATSVPEPSNVSLALLGSALLANRRKNR